MQDAQLDEAQLEVLVTAFYARVRSDPLLAPVFNKAIDDWPAHLEKLAAFWSSVMLATGRYKGQPMMAHLRHRASITPAMFERWLALWAETTEAMAAPPAAAALQEKAARIAESLQLGIQFHPDRTAASLNPQPETVTYQGAPT